MIKKIKFPEQLKTLLNKLSNKKNRRLLLVESDGFTLHALLVQVLSKGVNIEQAVSSRAITPAAALTEVIGQLKQAGFTPPKDALLVTSNAISALLKLPVSSEKKLSKPKMAELVRWEMETIFSEHTSLWNIGWLLIGRGYMDERQRDEVLADIDNVNEMSDRRSSRAPARFGEAAINMGFVTRVQLEECLQMQEQLHLLDDSLQCAWTDEPTSVGSQPGLWLCGAVSPELKQGWMEAFSAHEIALKWIYPSPIASSALLPETKGPQVLLYLHQGCVACCQVNQGQITQFTQQKCGDHSITVTELLELLQPVLNAEVSEIWVTGNHARREALVESLQTSLERPFVSLDEHATKHYQLTSEFGEGPGITALLGAVQHQTKKSLALTAVCLRGKPAPPPMYFEPRVQLAAAVILCVIATASNEWHYIWKENYVNDQIRLNDERASNTEAINSELTLKNSAYKTLDGERQQLLGEFKQLKSSKEVIEVVLISRQRFIGALLPMLSQTVNDQLILTKVSEKAWYQFEITGWAQNQAAIDYFNETLSRALSRWNLQISDSPSEIGTGRGGLPGYRFIFSIGQKRGDV